MGDERDGQSPIRKHLVGSAESRRIQADLERRGVAAEFSQPIAERLGEAKATLSSEQYTALLDGVAAVYDVYREDCASFEESARDIDEIRRLMEGFTGELRKLEEGLRILSAFLYRMRDRTARDKSGILH